MEKRLSSFDPSLLDLIKGKATSLKTELEASTKIKTTPGKKKKIEMKNRIDNILKIF